MSDFGMFESDEAKQAEPRLAARTAGRKLEAAIDEVRAKFGRFLVGATGIDEFGDRWHLSKADIRATVEPHVFPNTGTMRRVMNAMKQDWKLAHPYKLAIDHEDAGFGSMPTADHERNLDTDETYHPSSGNLIPSPDFEGWKDSVDQGGPEKVQRDFTPGGDSGSDRHARIDREAASLVADIYSDFAQANGMRVASLDTLDHYASTGIAESDYRLLESMILRTAEDCDEDDEDDDESESEDSEDSEGDGEAPDFGGSDDSEDTDGDGDHDDDDHHDGEGGEEEYDFGDENSDGEHDDADHHEEAGEEEYDFGGGDEGGAGGQQFTVPEQAPELDPQMMQEIPQDDTDGSAPIPPEVIDSLLGLPEGTIEQLLLEEVSQGAQGAPQAGGDDFLGGAGGDNTQPPRMARRRRASDDFSVTPVDDDDPEYLAWKGQNAREEAEALASEDAMQEHLRNLKPGDPDYLPIIDIDARNANRRHAAPDESEQSLMGRQRSQQRDAIDTKFGPAPKSKLNIQDLYKRAQAGDPEAYAQLRGMWKDRGWTASRAARRFWAEEGSNAGPTHVPVGGSVSPSGGESYVFDGPAMQKAQPSTSAPSGGSDPDSFAPSDTLGVSPHNMQRALAARRFWAADGDQEPQQDPSGGAQPPQGDPSQGGDPAAMGMDPAAMGGGQPMMPPPGSQAVAPPQPPQPMEDQPAEDALLDTANQAIMQMIDRETQEYQQIIDPLSQALQAIQFAQQVEQAEHPMDVTPPEGTVNVDPSQAPGGQPPMQQQARRRQAKKVGVLRNAARLIAGRYGLSHGGERMLIQAMGRRNYEHVREALQLLPPDHLQQPEHRAAVRHIGEMFAAENPRFNRDVWMRSVLGSAPGSRLPFDRPRLAGETMVHTPTMDAFEWENDQPRIDDNIAVNDLPKMVGASRADDAVSRFQRWTQWREQNGLVVPGGEGGVHAWMQKTRNPAKPKVGPRASGEVHRSVGAEPDQPKLAPKTKPLKAVNPTLRKPKSAPKAPKEATWGEWEPARQASFFTRRVPGWRWDDHLNGYVSKEAKQFACSCGQKIATPSYRTCDCGKVWNVYAIGDSHHLASDTAEMYVAREIEVRPGVIMANRRMAGTFDDFFEWGDDVNDDMAKTFGLGGDDDDDDDESLESALEKLRDKPWNPDDNPGPDDPRIKGANRKMAGWGDWENIRKPDDEPPPSMENYRSHEDDEAEELARKRHDLGSYYPGKFMHADKGGCTCWEGYERVPGTEPCADGSCRKKTGAALFARLAAGGMSYEDAMAHIDDVLAEGEGHGLHRYPGLPHDDGKYSDEYEDGESCDYCGGNPIRGPGDHLNMCQNPNRYNRRHADWTKYDDDVDPVVETYGKSKIPSTKAPRIPRDWSRREPDGKWKNTNFAPKKK